MNRTAGGLRASFRLAAREASFCFPAVLATLALAGCVDGPRGAAEWSTTVRRSGDTTIVRTTGVEESAAILPLDESLRIGAADGPDQYTLGLITQGRALPGGGIIVWDEHAELLRQYDAEGRFVRDVGRAGEGPGEYGGSNGLAVTASHVFLWDADHGRVNVYDSVGGHSTSWPVPVNRGYLAGGLETDTAGNLYLRQPLGDREALLRVRVDDGVPLDTLPVPDGGAPPERLSAINTRGPMRTMLRLGVPFLPEPVTAFSPRGFIVSGNGGRYEVLMHIRPDSLVRLERDVLPIPVAAGERADLESAISTRMRRIDPSWRWEGPPIPSERPHFFALRVSADGDVWVRRSVAGTPAPSDAGSFNAAALNLPPTYDVFAPDGRFRGTVHFPPEATLLDAVGRFVWTTLEDSTGVPYLVRYEFPESTRR